MIQINLNVDEVKDAILSVKENTEKIYFFNSGNQADFIKETISYSPTQFNVFGIYLSLIHI